MLKRKSYMFFKVCYHLKTELLSSSLSVRRTPEEEKPCQHNLRDHLFVTIWPHCKKCRCGGFICRSDSSSSHSLLPDSLMKQDVLHRCVPANQFTFRTKCCFFYCWFYFSHIMSRVCHLLNWFWKQIFVVSVTEQSDSCVAVSI